MGEMMPQDSATLVKYQNMPSIIKTLLADWLYGLEGRPNCELKIRCSDDAATDCCADCEWLQSAAGSWRR